MNAIKRFTTVTTALAAGALLMACGVSQSTYDETVDALEQSQAALDECQQERMRMAARVSGLSNTVEAADEQLDTCFADLEDQNARLRAIERENRQREAVYNELVDTLQEMIDAGQLNVEIERNRLVIRMPQEVLFASGSAHVTDSGAAALRDLGRALSQFEDRSFQVEGHTDNVPINNAEYESNWELSTARAVAVVDVLIDAGVDPANLSAAGFGEWAPRASNATSEGRQLNRRIEIVMLPNLEALPQAFEARM